MALVAGAPCPFCGSVRALALLFRGSIVASVRLHPLAVPFAIAIAVVAEASFRATLVDGTPKAIATRPYGRQALGFYAGVAFCMALLWLLRELGAFGGPVIV